MITLLARASGIREKAELTLPHVLLILDQLPKALGGGERMALRTAALLPKYGFRASVLTFAAHPESSALLSAPCDVYLLPLTRTYDLNAMRAAGELKKFLANQDVRIVQTFFESSDLWAGAITKATSDASLVWSRRDMGILRGRKHDIAYRLFARLPDAVFAVSEKVRGHCIDVDRIDAGKVKTIYNGIDVADWGAQAFPSPSTRSHRVVTTVGNIRRVKGHDVLVRAAAEVVRRFPDVTFTVAGDVLEPEYFADLQRGVRDLRIEDRFRFIGPISDLHAHLVNANIFVLPSRSEGFSNAIVEAMAASLPVVATTVGGNGEAIEEGKTGYLIAPEDHHALADRLTRLLENPESARNMGIAGREMVAERFTTDAMMRQITDVYGELLRNKKAEH